MVGATCQSSVGLHTENLPFTERLPVPISSHPPKIKETLTINFPSTNPLLPFSGHRLITMARNDYYSNNHFLYYLQDLAFPGIHLLFFVSVLLLVLASSIYLDYVSLLDDLTSNLRLFLLACPLLLLLLLHLLSSEEDRLRIPFFLSLPEKDSFHRAGGSPWGVAVVLVLLLFMVSHRSAFLERWFPLLSRR